MLVMNIFRSILKTCSVFAILLFVAIASILFYLQEYPVRISNKLLDKISIFYKHEFALVGEDGILRSKNFKIELLIPKIIFKKDSETPINIGNIDLSWNVLSFNGNFLCKIAQSELLPLIKVSNNAILQKYIDEFSKQHHIKFDGEISANFNLAKLLQTQLTLTSKEGLHVPIKENQIKLNELNLFLVFKDNRLSVKQFDFIYESGTKASLSGDFFFSKKELLKANFIADVENLPVSYLAGLWPKFLFPDIHQWVNEHVIDGVVKKAHGEFNFTEKDLEEGTEIAKESINTEIEIQNATLRYLEEFTPIKNINTVVRINGTSLSLETKNASLKSTKISELELNLPFDNMKLALKAKVSGRISDFEEFVPITVQKKLARAGIDCKKIQGSANGQLDLIIPTENEEFNIKDVLLNIKAELNDVMLDKLGLIKIKNSIFELTNEEEKIQVKVNNKNLLSFELTYYHDDSKQHDNLASFNAVLDVDHQIVFNGLKINSGDLKIEAQIKEKEWSANLDLTNSEFIITDLGYTKPSLSKASVLCSGVSDEFSISSNNCVLQGNKFKGNIDFNYSYNDGNLNNLSLNNMQIGPNQFYYNFARENSFLKYNISAKKLDLSHFVLDNFDDKLSNYLINFKIDQIILKNDISLSEMNGKIGRIGNNSPEMSISAKTGSDKIILSKAKKDDKDFYSLYSSNAASFTKAFGIYDNIKKGNLMIEIFPETIDGKVDYHGNILIKDFYLSNTSILTKIILGILSPLNSPSAVAQSMQGGSLKADSFTADFFYKNSRFILHNGLISGPSYEVKLNGFVDMTKRNINIKGLYIPSFYGINKIIEMIPLLGNLISGGDKSAFLAANFEIRGDFKNPSTSVNPLSLFTPGFIRNLFN